MKFEEIKMGDVFRYAGVKETVISKNDRYRIITTIDSDTIPTAWEENELYMLEPIKEELPEEGLLVSERGSLAYKLSGGSSYGFACGKQSDYFSTGWEFLDGHWTPATPKQEVKFVEMLKKECEDRGLFEDTKIEEHANGDPLAYSDFMGFAPSFSSTHGYNKNGQIFYKGKFATPLKEKSTKLLVVDLNNYTTETTESGVIILTPLKKQYE